MRDGGKDTAIHMLDGTYVYIQVSRYLAISSQLSLAFQKSQSNAFQRKSFSPHKKRSLLKPMMIVSTTDYIVACIRPFFFDFSNNDASMMKSILLENIENVLGWIHEVDHQF
jgi:hypothetical protein